MYQVCPQSHVLYITEVITSCHSVLVHSYSGSCSCLAQYYLMGNIQNNQPFKILLIILSVICESSAKPWRLGQLGMISLGLLNIAVLNGCLLNVFECGMYVPISSSRYYRTVLMLLQEVLYDEVPNWNEQLQDKLACDRLDIADRLSAILADKGTKGTFLALKGRQAQSALNLLQQVGSEF